MEIKQFQNEANKIVESIDKKFEGREHDKEITMIHLTEELGEIARQVYNGSHKRGNFDRENLADEMADVFILLSRLAVVYNIDIEDAINLKIKKLKEKHNLI